MTRRRGLWTAALGTMVLMIGFGTVHVHTSDAAFTDVERAATAEQFGTVVLQPPTIVATSCTRPNLLNLTQPFLTVQWRWPQAASPYAGLSASNVRWSIEGKRAQATTSGPNGSGVYTTRFSGNLLQELLGSITDLLGSRFSVSARTIWTPGSAEWQSDQVKSIGVDLPLLAGISCPNPDA